MRLGCQVIDALEPGGHGGMVFKEPLAFIGAPEHVDLGEDGDVGEREVFADEEGSASL